MSCQDEMRKLRRLQGWNDPRSAESAWSVLLDAARLVDDAFERLQCERDVLVGDKSPGGRFQLEVARAEKLGLKLKTAWMRDGVWGAEFEVREERE